ncbi:ABC transporter permease [Conexibacter sp. CPCC 206217]|uniref:ABC transporter permease n=1 Tax=Conexibacter sp. CPCC 206217 TaxID=3064574 RepID=UPI002722F88B|nr:ABC transporter permease [Conexibacter sp. CPCC 206217]MDO8212148.1 ABC transporter permease [Conexibacter sp. CPCC 206217]
MSSTIEAAEAVPALVEGAARPASRRLPRPTLVLSLLIVAFFVVAALVPALLTSRSPVAIDLADALRAPSLSHPMGTDQSGRDVYTRVVYGARQSLLIGLGATAIGLSLALLLGTLAGLGPRLVDGVVNRFLEVAFAFPVLLLALLLVAVFGASVSTEIVAVGVGIAPGYARMVRGQVLAVKGSGYVEAAHALGHSFGRVTRRHILPNALRPLVVVGTMGVGQSIVWASGLAFLGLGVAPPASEWGAMLDAGRSYVTHAWWLEVMPGLAIVAFTMAVTTIGRYVQLRLEGGLDR